MSPVDRVAGPVHCAAAAHAIIVDITAVSSGLGGGGRRSPRWWLVSGHIVPSRLVELETVPHVQLIDAARALLPQPAVR